MGVIERSGSVGLKLEVSSFLPHRKRNIRLAFFFFCTNSFHALSIIYEHKLCLKIYVLWISLLLSSPRESSYS